MARLDSPALGLPNGVGGRRAAVLSLALPYSHQFFDLRLWGDTGATGAWSRIVVAIRAGSGVIEARHSGPVLTLAALPRAITRAAISCGSGAADSIVGCIRRCSVRRRREQQPKREGREKMFHDEVPPSVFFTDGVMGVVSRAGDIEMCTARLHIFAR